MKEKVELYQCHGLKRLRQEDSLVTRDITCKLAITVTENAVYNQLFAALITRSGPFYFYPGEFPERRGEWH